MARQRPLSSKHPIVSIILIYSIGKQFVSSWPSYRASVSPVGLNLQRGPSERYILGGNLNKLYGACVLGDRSWAKSLQCHLRTYLSHLKSVYLNDLASLAQYCGPKRPLIWVHSKFRKLIGYGWVDGQHLMGQ